MAMMATSKKPLFLPPLIVFITTYLMLQLHGVNSFRTCLGSFPDFHPDQRGLVVEGEVSVSSSRSLQLTWVDSDGNPEGDSVGRVRLPLEFRLWDRSSGQGLDFQTGFRFTIWSPDPSTTPAADGLAFFMASPGTTLPPHSGGGHLGLFHNRTRGESSTADEAVKGVVAVEFDTYTNRDVGDPDYAHMGINVNSIRSRATAKWEWQNGREYSVHIVYYSALKRLGAMIYHPGGTNSVELFYDIDLTTVLPEWFEIGLSASTGLYSQVNNVHSWFFQVVWRNVTWPIEQTELCRPSQPNEASR